MALEAATAHTKVACAAAKPVRLVNEQIQALAALEEALNVLGHDATHIVNLAPRVANGVALAAARGAIVHHEGLERAVEGAGAVVGHVGKIARLGKLGEEAPAHLDQVAKGDAATEGGVGNDEKGQAAGRGVVRVLRGRLGYVVNLVATVRVRELLRLVVLDFREDEGGQRRGLG